MNNLSFKNYLERKEINLFHGTTTGEEEKTLDSFRKKGIKPHSSMGWGQGSGYYVYGEDPKGKNREDKARMAIGHARSLVNPETAPRTGAPHSGSPMVVVHKAKLNPKDYDLDKEIQSKDIQKFLISNQESINKFLKNNNGIEIDPTPEATFTNSLRIYEIFDHIHDGEPLVGFWLVDPKTIVRSKQKPNNSTNIIIRPKNLMDAADLQAILKVLFEKMPELRLDYKKFVRSIMKRTAEGRLKPRAWKYIGSEPIKPSTINVEEPGLGWRNKL